MSILNKCQFLILYLYSFMYVLLSYYIYLSVLEEEEEVVFSSCFILRKGTDKNNFQKNKCLKFWMEKKRKKSIEREDKIGMWDELREMNKRILIIKRVISVTKEGLPYLYI